MPTKEEVEGAAQGVFAQMDLNNDGWLSEDECKNFAKAMHSKLASDKEFDEEAFTNGWAETDKNSDGKVSKDELIAAIMKKAGL